MSELNQNKSLLAADVVEDYLHTTRMREMYVGGTGGELSLHAALVTEHLVSHRHHLCLISFICVCSKWDGVFGLQLSVKLLSSSHPALHIPT